MKEPASPADTPPIRLPRSSGLLLHITSLPGPFGIGDLGPDAYRFADVLFETGQRIWQVLPLVPIGLGNSPYSSPSTFALSPLFVSPVLLEEDGLIESMPDAPAGTENPVAEPVDFEAAAPFKSAVLQQAFERFESGDTPVDPAAFDAFRARHAAWLDDYALFMALKEHHGGVEWTRWPTGLAMREPAAIEAFVDKHGARVRRHAFDQFVVFDQWDRLKRYCNEREIWFFGDLPIYVAHDSADVWASRELFHLDDDGRSTVVAGVPPDYFSETGQRWGNPIYRWDVMEKRGYAWWTRRIEAVLRHADLVRLDHFRGFAGYWEIPAEEQTAVHGRWAEGPGPSLFEAVRRKLGTLPLVAEDLGLITPDVKQLIDAFDFPGMAVLQFAFHEGADHPFLPHAYHRNLVAYTGTHDNDTLLGWWQDVAGDPDQERARRFASAYLGVENGGAENG
ncbi:MAG: 4-alpha-glucanotransferase, partial [Rhodothermales bacterium]